MLVGCEFWHRSSKSFEDQVEKRPLPSPPTTGKLGPHAWKSLVSNVLNILSSSSSPLTSLPSPSPSYLSSRSQRSVFYRLLRRDQFQPAQHFHITRLYFGADLRDWQTLIRDFEIGVTRCQTSESDSLQSQEEVPEHRIEHYWTNLLVKKSSVAISKIWKHYRPLFDPNG